MQAAHGAQLATVQAAKQGARTGKNKEPDTKPPRPPPLPGADGGGTAHKKKGNRSDIYISGDFFGLAFFFASLAIFSCRFAGISRGPAQKRRTQETRQTKKGGMAGEGMGRARVFEPLLCAATESGACIQMADRSAITRRRAEGPVRGILLFPFPNPRRNRYSDRFSRVERFFAARFILRMAFMFTDYAPCIHSTDAKRAAKNEALFHVPRSMSGGNGVSPIVSA